MDEGVSSTVQGLILARSIKQANYDIRLYKYISTYFVYNHQQHHSAVGRGIRKTLITLTITIVSPVLNGVQVFSSLIDKRKEVK